MAPRPPNAGLAYIQTADLICHNNERRCLTNRIKYFQSQSAGCQSNILTNGADIPQFSRFKPFVGPTERNKHDFKVTGYFGMQRCGHDSLKRELNKQFLKKSVKDPYPWGNKELQMYKQSLQQRARIFDLTAPVPPNDGQRFSFGSMLAPVTPKKKADGPLVVVKHPYDPTPQEERVKVEVKSKKKMSARGTGSLDSIVEQMHQVQKRKVPIAEGRRDGAMFAGIRRGATYGLPPLPDNALYNAKRPCNIIVKHSKYQLYIARKPGILVSEIDGDALMMATEDVERLTVKLTEAMESKAKLSALRDTIPMKYQYHTPKTHLLYDKYKTLPIIAHPPREKQLFLSSLRALPSIMLNMADDVEELVPCRSLTLAFEEKLEREEKVMMLLNDIKRLSSITDAELGNKLHTTQSESIQSAVPAPGGLLQKKRRSLGAQLETVMPQTLTPDGLTLKLTLSRSYTDLATIPDQHDSSQDEASQ